MVGKGSGAAGGGGGKVCGAGGGETQLRRGRNFTERQTEAKKKKQENCKTRQCTPQFDMSASLFSTGDLVERQTHTKLTQQMYRRTTNGHKRKKNSTEWYV